MAPSKRVRTSSTSCGSGGWLWCETSSMRRRPRFRDAVFKTRLLTSFLANGELRLALTCQCVEDCDRALVVKGETERRLLALEPGLWNACERVRESLAVAPTDGTALPESWWRELQDGVWAIARHQALTSVGLRAKGEIFHDLWLFAEETELWGALQMSYLRDFDALAAARMSEEGFARARRKAG